MRNRDVTREPGLMTTTMDMNSRESPSLALLEQLRQLGNIHRNPQRLILADQLGCLSAARPLLEIDVVERLAVGVTHRECGSACSRATRCGSR